MDLNRHEAWRRAVARFGVPPFGLAGWAGSRRVAGWGGATPEDVAAITLEYGVARIDTEDPFVWVQTSVNGPDDLFPVDELIRPGLANIVSHGASATPALSPPVEQVDFEVNGRPLTFALVLEGSAWCAFRWLDDLAVALAARGVAPSAVELVPADEHDYLRRERS